MEYASRPVPWPAEQKTAGPSFAGFPVSASWGAPDRSLSGKRRAGAHRVPGGTPAGLRIRTIQKGGHGIRRVRLLWLYVRWFIPPGYPVSPHRDPA